MEQRLIMKLSEDRCIFIPENVAVFVGESDEWQLSKLDKHNMVAAPHCFMVVMLKFMDSPPGLHYKQEYAINSQSNPG